MALMSFTPAGLGALLYLMSTTASAQVYDIAYVAFHSMFELMRVVCEAEGARCVASARVRGTPRFAAVSGMSSCACLLLQSGLQLMANSAAMHLAVTAQFRVLAALLLMLCTTYISFQCVHAWRAARSAGCTASDSTAQHGCSGSAHAYEVYHDGDDACNPQRSRARESVGDCE